MQSLTRVIEEQTQGDTHETQIFWSHDKKMKIQNHSTRFYFFELEVSNHARKRRCQ